MVSAVSAINPTVSRLSFVRSPIRTGGRLSVVTVSAASGDRCLRSRCRTVVIGGTSQCVGYNAGGMRDGDLPRGREDAPPQFFAEFAEPSGGPAFQRRSSPD